MGEILLVMIGILLALQVNNWNENRKKEVLAIQYLNRLVQDLTFDTSYYNQRTEQSKNVINRNHQVIRLMYQTQESAEDVKNFWKLISWPTEHLTTQNSTYTELTNSGNLDIFKNQELKTSIIQYYREIELAAKGIAEFDEVSTRHLIHLGQVSPTNIKLNPTLSEVFADLPLNKNEWEFINDPSSEKFQILTLSLGIYVIKHSEYLDYFRKLKNKSSQLINDIKKELESRK